MTTNSLTTCCESTGRSIADSGVTGSAQTPVYCPVYESRLLATARHELSSAAALGVYGSPYTGGQGYGNYVTYGTDASAFYSLVSHLSDPFWHWLMEPWGAEAGARRTCLSPKDTCFPVIYPRLTPILKDIIKTDYLGVERELYIKLGDKTELNTRLWKKTPKISPIKL